MIYLFMPGQPVPDWLEKFEFINPTSTPSARFNGFGMVVKVKGEYHLWIACGTAIYIDGGGGSVIMRGQGKGVFMWSSFISWASAIWNTMK